MFYPHPIKIDAGTAGNPRQGRRNGVGAWVLGILIAALLLAAPALAEQAPTPNATELSVIEKINTIRTDPLKYAASIGLNRGAVLSRNADIRDQLTDGFAPLRYNGNLYLSASEARLAAFQNGHPDGETRPLEERLAERGFTTGAADEAVTSLAFFNFIATDRAVDLMLSQIFKDEVSGTSGTARRILSTSFTDVGASISSGTLGIQGKSYRAYLLVVDTAVNAYSDAALTVLQLANHARALPIDTAACMGVDTANLPDEIKAAEKAAEKARKKNDPAPAYLLSDVLENGLPPLSPDAALTAAAAGHARDMIDNQFFSEISFDGRSLLDRLSAQGLETASFSEFRGFMSVWAAMEPVAVAKVFFENQFKNEINADFDGRVLLDPTFGSVGVSFITDTADYGDGTVNDQHALVVDAADLSGNGDTKYLIGSVYEDSKGCGLFADGEGLFNIRITIVGPDMDRTLYTDAAGGFAIPVAPGEYRVQAYPPTGYSEKTVTVADENAFVRFAVPVF